MEGKKNEGKDKKDKKTKPDKEENLKTIPEKETKKDEKKQKPDNPKPEKHKENEVKEVIEKIEKDSKPKQLKKFFCISSYEEISEMRKKQISIVQESGIFAKKQMSLSTSSSFQSYNSHTEKNVVEIFKILKPFDLSSIINDEFFLIFLKLYKSNLDNQREICDKIIDALINYCKKVDISFNYDIQNYNYGLLYLTTIKKTFDKISNAIRKITFVAGGIENTLNYISRLFAELFTLKDTSLSEIKEILFIKLVFLI